VENNENLVWKSAVELTQMMQAGTVSSREVTTAHLEHIDRVNPDVNAIVTLLPDHALAMADAADARQAAGESLGILHGIPTAHKDLFPTAGIRTTRGSPLFADDVPTENALIIQRQIDAGVVTLGKTNTPEFGMGSNTFNPVFGATANPYDRNKTAGGSSGGASAALASGMVPIADGSDMGGSLRNPAAFCNVVGLRPSPGRVPDWPKQASWDYLAVSGPMARTVDDVALLLAAQAGPDPRVPIALDQPGTNFIPPIAAATDSLQIAWAPDLGGLPIAPEVTAALAAVPDVFAGLGHHVEDACPDLSGAFMVFDTVRAWFYAMALGESEHLDQVKETAQWNVQRGLDLSIGDHIDAFKVRAEIFQRTATFFETYDFLLCPVTQVAPFDLDLEYPTEIGGVEMTTYIEWMRVCTDVTVMNCPAISIPAGFTPDGLPIGLQIVGPPRADRAVLEIAKQFETATNVAAQRPPGL